MSQSISSQIPETKDRKFIKCKRRLPITPSVPAPTTTSPRQSTSKKRPRYENTNTPKVEVTTIPTPNCRRNDCRFRAPKCLKYVVMQSRVYVRWRNALSFMGYNEEASYKLCSELQLQENSDLRYWLREPRGGLAAFYYDCMIVSLFFFFMLTLIVSSYE